MQFSHTGTWKSKTTTGQKTGGVSLSKHGTRWPKQYNRKTMLVLSYKELLKHGNQQECCPGYWRHPAPAGHASDATRGQWYKLGYPITTLCCLNHLWIWKHAVLQYSLVSNQTCQSGSLASLEAGKLLRWEVCVALSVQHSGDPLAASRSELSPVHTSACWYHSVTKLTDRHNALSTYPH